MQSKADVNRTIPLERWNPNIELMNFQLGV